MPTAGAGPAAVLDRRAPRRAGELAGAVPDRRDQLLGRATDPGWTRAGACSAAGAWPPARTCSAGRGARRAPRWPARRWSSPRSAETDGGAGRGPRRTAPADPRRCAGRCTCGTWTPGSDGSEEWEILALLNPVYDVHRLGIFLTASPRHADVLLVTGAGAHGMTEPLRRTYDAMPDPKIVIAVGTDAVSGGLRRPSYATTRRRRRHGAGGRVGAGLPAEPVQPSCTRCCSGSAGCPGRQPGEVGSRDRRSGLGPRCAGRPGRWLGRAGRWPAMPWRAGCAGAGWLRPVPYLLARPGRRACSPPGAGALAGRPGRAGPRLAGSVLGHGTGLAADRLSGLFLVIAFGAAVPVSLLALRGLGCPGRTATAGAGSAPATR